MRITGLQTAEPRSSLCCQSCPCSLSQLPAAPFQYVSSFCTLSPVVFSRQNTETKVRFSPEEELLHQFLLSGSAERRKIFKARLTQTKKLNKNEIKKGILTNLLIATFCNLLLGQHYLHLLSFPLTSQKFPLYTFSAARWAPGSLC